MNVLTLLQRAKDRLQTNDPTYQERADTTVAILRSSGVLPFKRSSLNGGLHKLMSAAIVEAYEADTTIDVSTRKAGTFHHYGYSTKIPSYLTKMVDAGLLVSETGKAKGKLAIGGLLDTYLTSIQT